MNLKTAEVEESSKMKKIRVKAAVINGVNEDYQIEELTLGELYPDEVIVKMVASGMCHSDEALRVGDANYPLPAVLGHEGAGIIEEVGSAVKDFNVGDQVIMAYNYCGTCPSCRTGHPSSCNQWPALNMSGGRADGSHMFYKEDGTPVSNFFTQSSFASHTITNVNNLIKVDPEVDLRLVGSIRMRPSDRLWHSSEWFESESCFFNCRIWNRRGRTRYAYVGKISRLFQNHRNRYS